MLLSKIKIWEFLKEYKMRYVILEIILICTGVMLATFINNRIQHNDNNKLIRENLMMTIENLKDNLEVNKYYLKIEKDRLEKYQRWNVKIKKKDSSWMENKDYLVDLTNIMHISNHNIGIKNLLSIDVHKVKSRSFVLDCYKYAELMGYGIEDLNNFNRSIENYAYSVSPYLIDVNFLKGTVQGVSDIERFYADNGLQNQINRLIYERDIYLDTMEKAILPRTSELISKLEEVLKEY